MDGLSKKITKEQIDSVLNHRGFYYNMLTSNYSMYDYVQTSTGVHVFVYPQNNSFELFYIPHYTIFELKSPNCAPLYEETPQYHQLDRMLRKFLKVVQSIDFGNP